MSAPPQGAALAAAGGGGATAAPFAGPAADSWLGELLLEELDGRRGRLGVGCHERLAQMERPAEHVPCLVGRPGRGRFGGHERCPGTAREREEQTAHHQLRAAG